MPDEMRSLLNAYLDGELHGRLLAEMEDHLATCKNCQEELEQLRFVSDLMQTAAIPDFPPAELFASRLALILPRRKQREQPPKTLFQAQWLIPAGLLGAWFFVRTVIILSDIITTANLTGLLGQAGIWFGGGEKTIWFSMATSLFGSQFSGLPSISWLNNTSILASGLISGFLVQLAIILLYWAWLISLWSYNDRKKGMAKKV